MLNKIKKEWIVIAKIKCRLFGHFYRPAHLMKGSLVQYTCDRCEKPTEWMYKTKHKEFIEKYCPTWGEPGSDSQKYKKNPNSIFNETQIKKKYDKKRKKKR